MSSTHDNVESRWLGQPSKKTFGYDTVLSYFPYDLHLSSFSVRMILLFSSSEVV